MEIGLYGEKFTKAYFMIKRISRKELNIEKYTECLHNSVNYRIYAESWYLDALVNKNWDCLVLNDYEAIMPLPFTRKIGIIFITQPTYCQQLGVFHTSNFTKVIFQEFEKRLHRNLVRSYAFNEENTEMFQPDGKLKINQILDLNFNYPEYLKSIRKDRKHQINKGLSDSYSISESYFDKDFIQLLKENYTEIKGQLQLESLAKLVKEIQAKKLGLTLNLKHENNIIASSFYLRSKNRLIQLCNAKSPQGNINFNTFIVDYIIQNNLNQDLILDFEGSSLKGVQDFNSSFRAEVKYFTIYKNLPI